MSHYDDSNVENQPVFMAFNCFLLKLKDFEWLSHASREEIKSCLHSAKSIETMLETLQNNDALDGFKALVPDLFGQDWAQLHKACDIVLAKVLTAAGVSTAYVRTCVDEYFQLCGSDRFEYVLSSVILCSEIYRILLDYLASFEGDLEQTAIELQSQLFICLWRDESDCEKLNDTFYSWLVTDSSHQKIAAALQVITMSEDNNIASSIVFALGKVLQDREDPAVMFWSVFFKLPKIRKALERSNELLINVLKFLKTSAHWMEATATFTWVSREEGPCRAIGFEKIVKALECLLAEVPTSEITKQFLVKRNNSAGCTFWDDVETKLNCQIH